MRTSDNTYSQTYAKYVAWVQSHFYWKKHERLEILRLLGAGKHGRILDFGCNNGYLASVIQARNGAEVYGTDINTFALADGKRLYPEVRFVSLDDIQRMDIQFDAIVLSHVLEHVPDCCEILDQLVRFLPTDGRMIIVVPQERVRGDCNIPHIVFSSFKNRSYTNPHVRVIKKKDLIELLEGQGMMIEESMYVNFAPPARSKRYIWPIALSLVASCKRIPS